jgi:hypothetical protein
MEQMLSMLLDGAVGCSTSPRTSSVSPLKLQMALAVIDRDLLHWPAHRIAAWTSDSAQQQADRMGVRSCDTPHIKKKGYSVELTALLLVRQAFRPLGEPRSGYVGQ